MNKSDFAHTVPSSQLRQNSGEVMDTVLRGQTVAVTRYGRPAMVLLPVSEYEALINARTTLAHMIRKQVNP